MRNNQLCFCSLSGLAIVGGLLAASPAMAQADTSATPADQGFIIVTARKKDESDLEVPIAIKAIGADQLDRSGIQSLQDVAAITPSLNVSAAAGSAGGAITMRGVGSPPTSGSGYDQGVAINVDGVTLVDGNALRLGQFDIARVEVLQGPQSLYFGKNASGGIVSVVSAAPTSSPYAMLRVGYGFEARELLTEAVISGPLSDTMGGRLALYRSDMRGFFKNGLAANFDDAQPSPIFGAVPEPNSARAPDRTLTGARATLQFDPSEALSIKLKGTYMDYSGASSFDQAQLFYCPSGAPSLNGVVIPVGTEDCKLDHIVAPLGSTVTADVGGDPRYRDGEIRSNQDLLLLSGMIDYEVADGVMLSSITSYYDQEVLDVQNVAGGAWPFFGAIINNGRDEFTQELRVTTDLDSPINGMFGVFYQDQNLFADSAVYLLPSPGIGAAAPRYDVSGRTYAVFGQLTLDISDAFQIAAGGRYSDEEKTLSVFDKISQSFVQDLLATDTTRAKKFSPEVTVSYRPDTRTNVFLTYKRGTKSGGFNLGTLFLPPFDGVDRSYEDENAEGFEGGIKTVLADGQLRFDLTGYRYEYKDLQVTAYDPELSTANVLNAAAMRTYGLQLSTNFSPRAAPGLSLAASADYTHARFREFLASCYTGQTIAEGCNINAAGDLVGPGEVGVSQDISGRPTLFAPDWAGSVSANYEFPISESATMVGLSVGATYSDGFETIQNQPPGSSQDSSVNLDATLRLFNDDSGWEVALIGKNLTDTLRVRWATESPLTGSGGTTGTAGPGVRSDLLGVSNAPRTIMLRLTFKPFGG